MLYADKRALETNLKVSLLQIREKELNFYTQNCLAVGTQAALLSGFSYAGLTQVSIPPDAHYVVKLFYLLFTTGAMSCELIAVLNTTLLSMLGPGLALRGPDGSMHKAVDGMMLEYRRAFFIFAIGLIAFHMSALMFGWLMFHPVVAVSMTTCILVSLRVLWRYAVRIFAKFQLPKEMAISGRFAGQDEGEGATTGDGRVIGSLIQREQHLSTPAGPGPSSVPGAVGTGPSAASGPSSAQAQSQPPQGVASWMNFKFT